MCQAVEELLKDSQEIQLSLRNHCLHLDNEEYSSANEIYLEDLRVMVITTTGEVISEFWEKVKQ